MTSPSSSGSGRQPLSMQTEYARQQQFITVGMLLVLLGPLTLLVAGVLAGPIFSVEPDGHSSGSETWYRLVYRRSN